MHSIRDIIASLPDDATLPVGWIRAQLAADPPPPPAAAVVEAPASWRERIWIVPAETRLSVDEAAEACGHPTSWVYRRTMRVTPNEKARAARKGTRVPPRIPHRRLDGRVVILAGELRDWIQANEDVGVPARPRAVR